MVSALTHAVTSGCSWQRSLDSISPAAAALLSAIALWVAARARSISEDARQTSEVRRPRSGLERRQRAGSVSDRAAPDPRRSWSTTADADSTSTSPGDEIGRHERPSEDGSEQ